jgi:hypothetical protein
VYHGTCVPKSPQHRNLNDTPTHRTSISKWNFAQGPKSAQTRQYKFLNETFPSLPSSLSSIFRPNHYMIAKMNVRYDPVPDEINTPLPPSPRLHADDTSSSTPFLPQQSPALDLAATLPPAERTPSAPTAPPTPAALLAPTAPKFPFHPHRIRHAHRIYLTLETQLMLFGLWLCVKVFGDHNSTILVWIALGMVCLAPLPLIECHEY